MEPNTYRFAIVTAALDADINMQYFKWIDAESVFLSYQGMMYTVGVDVDLRLQSFSRYSPFSINSFVKRALNVSVV